MPDTFQQPLNASKGPLLVIPPDVGHSHWMPDNGGYTTTIITPWDHPMLGYSMGIQRLEPGEAVPEHHHDQRGEPGDVDGPVPVRLGVSDDVVG